MMGPSEKSILRWNGFLANTRNTYRSLRGNEEFSDLTLVSGDGKQARVHQVIMAGGSSLIRKILIENPHPHPLIYLKEVNYEHLLSLLDFVYTGEANIIEDHLNEFLDIAEDLKVKGLTLEKSVDQQPSSLQGYEAQELGSSRKIRNPRSPIPSQDPKATDDRAPAPDASHLRSVMSGASQSAVRIEVNPQTPGVSHPRSVMSSTSQGPTATEVYPPKPEVSHLRSVMSATSQSTMPGVSHQRSVMSAASQGPASTELHPPTPEVLRSTPHQGHVATEGRTSHLHNVMFAPQSKAATQERSTKNPHSVTSFSNGNNFPQYTGNPDDHDDTGYIKVEVADASHYNVYYGANEHGESYVSDASGRVDDKTMEQEENDQSLSTEQQLTEIKVDVMSNNEQSVHDWYQPSDENYTIMAQDEDNYIQVESEVVDCAFVDEELAHNAFDDDNNDDNVPDEEQDLFEKKDFQQKRSHTVKNPSFQCTVCLKVLSSSGNLNRHMRIHTGEKPYQCQVCSKMFTYNKTLDQHKKVHTGEKPYQCPHCSKMFSQLGNLYKHKKICLLTQPHSPKSALPQGQVAANETTFPLSTPIPHNAISAQLSSRPNPNSLKPVSHKYQVVAEHHVPSCKLPRPLSVIPAPHQSQVADSCRIPGPCGVKPTTHQDQMASEEAAQSLGMQQPCSDISSHLSNPLSQASCEKDHDKTFLVKVEVVDDRRLAYIGHVSMRGLEENGGNISFNEGIVLSAEQGQNGGFISSEKEPKEELIESNNDMMIKPSQHWLSSSKQSLRKQDKMINTQENLYHCLQCSKCFSQPSHLKRHEMAHTGGKPYQCVQCPKSFSKLCRLKSHEMIHTGEKPHQCAQCPKSFSQKKDLERHEMTHTGEKPYQCVVCSKSFSRLGNLKTHKMTHTAEKPNQCVVCSKSFSQLSNLKRHKKTHTGEKLH